MLMQGPRSLKPKNLRIRIQKTGCIIDFRSQSYDLTDMVGLYNILFIREEEGM